MQQYSYPLPSNSSSQLTLPLTRSLYHSSIVSPLQTSYMHANSRPPTFAQQHNENHVMPMTTGAGHRPAEDQQNCANHEPANRQPGQRRHGSANRSSDRGQKYRKHKRSSERKQKQRRPDVSSRRGETYATTTTPSCETSFHQVQELGIPETYKISYPHYYEDDIAECPTDYHRTNPSSRQQIWERQSSNRCTAESATHYADSTGDSKNRNKSKRLSSNLGDGRSPSAPTIMQYAELHFRDVGQEIDV